MELLISAFGSASRYSVSFDRSDVVALESFLATKDVFLSDKQARQFAATGKAVQFDQIRGKWMPSAVVTDNTEQARRDRFRAMVIKFKARWSASRISSNIGLCIHQGKRLQAIGKALNVEVNL